MSEIFGFHSANVKLRLDDSAVTFLHHRKPTLHNSVYLLEVNKVTGHWAEAG